MNDRPTTPDDDGGQPDPTVTFALRAMAPPEHGDAFWDHLDAALRNETVTPTTAVPLVEADPPPPPPLPPPPPMAEVVPLPPPRRSRPAAPWIAAAVAAVLVVAVAVGAVVRNGTTDVESTTVATGVPAESTTTAPPPTPVVPTTALVAPPTSRPAPTTTAAPRTTTTAKPMSLTLSPHGLGPLRLGMTAKQAEATGAVGAFEDPLDTGGACGHAAPAGTYRDTDFGSLFLDGRLARIYVSEGSRLRTPQDIGTGSPSSALSTVPGTRTESPHPYGGGTNVDIMTGDVGYQFTVDKGAVTEWSVGTAEALALPEGCA